MPGFDSPLGSKKVNMGQMREFTVPDESEYANMQQPQYPQMVEMSPEEIANFSNRLNGILPEQSDSDMEQQIREAKRARISGKEKISEGGKRRIDMLLGMTRMYREVKLDDKNTFVFQTLKSKEISQTSDELAKMELSTQVQVAFAMRRQLLARALVQVCGISIGDFLGSNTLDARLGFIDELDEAVIQRLYDEYNLLDTESKQKYGIKNEQDAKEVVEDLKK